MELNFICPVCFQEITTDDEMVGEEANCPTCEADITVPEPGTPSDAKLGGYTLERCLGKGRLGMVYLATHQTMHRRVALRILTPDLTQDEDYVHRFIEEIRFNARIEHPHVVPYYDVGEEKDRVYAAMSFVEGRSVMEELEEKGPLPVENVVGIGLTIAKTLKYIGAQYDILAQNLNPSNIFIDRHGEVKLKNLGVTRYQGDTPDLQSSLTVESVAYMSPEQTQGAELDCRSDMFSLGVSLYQLLTNELPYTSGTPGTSPKAVRAGISANVDQLIQCMLQKDLEKRYPDWDGVIRDFERVEEGQMPLRNPDGTETAPEAAPSSTASATNLRLKRDAAGGVSGGMRLPSEQPTPPGLTPPPAKTDGPLVAEAIPEDDDDEDEEVDVSDTPTMMESRREPIDSGDGKPRTPAGPKKIIIRVLIGILVLWGGFKYGFGPLISAMRKAESAVYVVNSSENDYKLSLGWRRLKMDLRGGGVAQFKLFVGMPEKQGLKAVPVDEGEKKKVKVPLRPGCRVLVNLNGGKTYHVYDESKIADATISPTEKLADQILSMKEPTYTFTLLQDIQKLGKRAYQSSTDAEVIDLTDYQTRMMMVGMTVDQDKTKPIMTEQPCTLNFKGGQLIYDAGNEKEYSGTVTLGKEGSIKILGNDVKVPANTRMTLSVNGDQMDVRGTVNNIPFTHQGVTYNGNWTYHAVKRPSPHQWTWSWSYSGQVDAPQAIKRITIRQPNKGSADVKTSEQKRTR